MRRCEECGGPGPCLWDVHRYCCRTCHSDPNDSFFRRRHSGVIVRFFRWVKNDKVPWWMWLLNSINEMDRCVCWGCLQDIDPDCCHCGIDHKKSFGDGGHGMIPMGCNCYRGASSHV